MIDLDALLQPLLQKPLGEPLPMDLLATRARQLRRGRRFRRSAAALVVTLTAAGAAVALHDSGAAPRVQTPARRTLSSFVPATHVDGDRTIMPLTFFDGTQLAITYPTSTHLAQRGFTPAASASVRTGPGFPDGRLIHIRYGRVADLTRHARRTATYPGPNGAAIGYYEGMNLRAGVPNALVFQFGPWAVFVEDLPRTHPAAMTQAIRAAWASNLMAHLTTDGFLVFDPHPEQFTLDGSDQPVGTIGSGKRSIQFLFARCGEGPATTPTPPPNSPYWTPVREDSRGILFCSTAVNLSIRIAAPRSLAIRIASHLRISSLRPGSVATWLLAGTGGQ